MWAKDALTVYDSGRVGSVLAVVPVAVVAGRVGRPAEHFAALGPAFPGARHLDSKHKRGPFPFKGRHLGGFDGLEFGQDVIDLVFRVQVFVEVQMVANGRPGNPVVAFRAEEQAVLAIDYEVELFQARMLQKDFVFEKDPVCLQASLLEQPKSLGKWGEWVLVSDRCIDFHSVLGKARRGQRNRGRNGLGEQSGVVGGLDDSVDWDCWQGLLWIENLARPDLGGKRLLGGKGRRLDWVGLGSPTKDPVSNLGQERAPFLDSGHIQGRG